MDWASFWTAVGAIVGLISLLLGLYKMFLNKRSERPETRLTVLNIHSQHVWICLELKITSRWRKQMTLKSLKAQKGIKLAKAKRIGSNLFSPDVSTAGRLLGLDTELPAISEDKKARGTKIIFFAARDKLDNDTDFLEREDIKFIKLIFISSNWWFGKITVKAR